MINSHILEVIIHLLCTVLKLICIKIKKLLICRWRKAIKGYWHDSGTSIQILTSKICYREEFNRCQKSITWKKFASKLSWKFWRICKLWPDVHVITFFESREWIQRCVKRPEKRTSAIVLPNPWLGPHLAKISVLVRCYIDFLVLTLFAFVG